MREKYESLALVELREVAKARGIKGTSAMRKADIVEVMLREDEKEKQQDEIMPEEAQAGNPEEKTVSDSSKDERLTSSREQNSRPQDKNPQSDRSRNERPQYGRQQGERFQSEHSQSERSQSERSQSERSQSEHSQGGSPEGGQRQEDAPRRVRTARNEGAPRSGVAARQTGAYRQPAVPRARSAARTEEPSRAADHARTEEAGNDVSLRAGEPARAEGAGRAENTAPASGGQPVRSRNEDDSFMTELDSGYTAKGILEVMPDGYGFIRSENYLPGESDVYVAPSQIRRFNLKTGDIVEGNTRVKTEKEKFSALLYVKRINGYAPEVVARRTNFEDMTPVFPDERLRLETAGASVAMRIMDLMSPVGKGQRGMIVSPPKAGKTTLLKEVAKSIKQNNPEMHMIILLIDERPEEVTDIREAIEGPEVEVIYSTFDELPEHHKRVSEMVIERAKRLVEHQRDVVILLDSITRLTRAYNLVVPPSGRTLSGGLDPAALHMPKRFFGAARNMRGGGSLTILATALVETGSKMDDVVYEEFKGTGNMEMVLDRKLSERRVFPAIDIPKSGTRREDLLLTPEEMEAINIIRKALNGMKADEAVDRVLDMFARTRSNRDFVEMVKRMRFL